ncbi:Late embryoproteinsis abundant protein D-34 [Hibiscus syriacus]|uniref:Late embryoproteinsis abundant protein D-34 n=1 Tax=Hibiscus syriacus TaxID=106335 RepID=A0A6A2Z0G9_HIBSY|nr:Late embryoproteinsis abundant protein D-34 [Hibiscus syriacus]
MFLSNKVGGGGGGHRLAIEVVFRLRKRWWSDEYNSVDDVMCPRWQEGSAAVAEVRAFIDGFLVDGGAWLAVVDVMVDVFGFVEACADVTGPEKVGMEDVQFKALNLVSEYIHFTVLGIGLVRVAIAGSLFFLQLSLGRFFNEVTGQHCQAAPLSSASGPSGDAGGPVSPITIGEALEATALTAGKKPVDWSDAAAIQAAEVRATGRTSIIPGGVGAAAESAANLNAKATTEEEKTKLRDILSNATVKLPSDKAATKGDAEGVKVAETSNDPTLTTHPAGVAANVATAARLNDKIAK